MRTQKASEDSGEPWGNPSSKSPRSEPAKRRELSGRTMFDDARRSIHGVQDERDKGGDPGHRGHALQDLCSPRLVVRITEINAYNEEVWVDLEEQT